jgi:hypothetical protein
MLLLVAACNNDTYGPTIHEYAGIDTSSIPVSVTEDSGEQVSIPVVYGGTLSNPTAFTVNYKIEGGVYGTDYTVVGGSSASGTVSIPAGATGDKAVGDFKIVPVADTKTEPNVELTITLVDASNGLSMGYPAAKSYVLTVEDDDCEYVADDYVGAAGGREFYSDGSEYPAGAPDYTVNFTSTGTNEFKMDDFWDSGWEMTFTVDPNTLEVTVPLQDLPSNYHVEGTGKVSTCSKVITIETHLYNTSGSYDDTHTNVYTFAP